MVNVFGKTKLRPMGGWSLIGTIPNDLVLKMGLIAGDIIIFCENSDGDIIIKKNGNGVHKP